MMVPEEGNESTRRKFVSKKIRKIMDSSDRMERKIIFWLVGVFATLMLALLGYYMFD